MGKILWQPSPERIEKSNMFAFLRHVNDTFGKKFDTYSQLYEWSISEIPDFWGCLWDWERIVFSKSYDRVVDDFTKMPGASWFSGARLNFAENLLRHRDDRIALSFRGEDTETRSVTYRELYNLVARLALSLSAMGIRPGDRIAGFMPNMIETVAAMLAATALGAVWSSCSPDFGARGVLDRFGQIAPRVLFTANGYRYGGKSFDSLESVAWVVEQIPSIERVVVVPYTDPEPDAARVPRAIPFDAFLAPAASATRIDFVQLPADHPVYILYSSGTTGPPKCIVHGAAGTLVQHAKELRLHSDVKREDTVFYYTTCGWMMWNWLASSLMLGARLMLYDGSPFYPDPASLWELAHDERITVFGTSARYLAALEKTGIRPRERHEFRSLKAVLSTGSPLSEESFEFVYRDIKSDLMLASISGGTDIISCFALGNPMGPVHAGELQCRGLGMKVESFNTGGESVIGQKGELVCTAAAPSMPIYFWNDPDAGKYREAYFDAFPGVWTHGDYVEISPRGSVIIYGRSDATLKPGGVRIGTAEIYRQVETIPEVLDSIVVGQEWEGDTRVVLFVKLRDGLLLDENLRKKIKTAIRRNTSPRHVPEKIVAVADIPYTISGKKVELAVRKTIHGQAVTNRDALANPRSLDLYRDIPEIRT